jgi:hypothetical protein
MTAGEFCGHLIRVIGIASIPGLLAVGISLIGTGIAPSGRELHRGANRRTRCHQSTEGR